MNVEMTPVMLNGQWQVLMTQHRAQFPAWSFWEYARMNSMRAAIRLGDTIIDVGTEQGELSVLLAKWAGPEGQMVLCEPSERMWATSRAVFEANGVGPPAFWWTGFIADAASSRHVEGCLGSKGWPAAAYARVHEEPGFARVEERPDIPSITIDELCAQAGLIPDVITIDVEGAEYLVTLGMESTLRDARPTVYFSVHPEMMREYYGHTPDDLLVHMGKMNYDALYLGFDHEQHFLFTPRP